MAGGFLGLTAPLAPRVVVSPLDSAFGAEGSEGSEGSKGKVAALPQFIAPFPRKGAVGDGG